jgi:hypothetical protein
MIFTVFSLLASNPALGDTLIPGGTVSGTWDLAGSAYLVYGDITVPIDSTLTIEPGVMVEFQGIYEFLVNGVLSAVGTEADSIFFTGPTAPAGPGWRGIRLIGAQEGTQLTYCNITNGRNVVGAPYDRGGGIYMYLTNPIISHTTITNCYADYGGGIYCELSDAVISDCNITANGVGLAYIASSAHGAGIYVTNCSPQITGNCITNNIGHGATIFSGSTFSKGGGIFLQYSNAQVSRNAIHGNNVDVSGYYGSVASGGGIYCEDSDADIINNTLSGNSATWGTNLTEGGGMAFVSCSPTVKNNIVEGSGGGGGMYFESSSGAYVGYNDLYSNQGGNFTGGNFPAGLGDIVTVNANGAPSDIYYNIFLDPIFENSIWCDYCLQAGSPCIDAGDPTLPYDPDATIADMGAFYFDQTITYDITIAVGYISGSPVPAGGGDLNYSLYAENHDIVSVDFSGWLEIAYEGGDPTTLAHRYFAGFPPATVIDRPNMTFSVPASYAAGNYTFTGKVGIHPNTAWDESGFPFVKSGSGERGTFIPWVPAGFENPFEGDFTTTEITANDFTLLSAYPNPFNPSTTINYRLSDMNVVNLAVYDVAGRKITELVNGWRDAGTHEVTFDASTLTSGVYVYQLTAGEFTASGKMVLMK